MGLSFTLTMLLRRAVVLRRLSIIVLIALLLPATAHAFQTAEGTPAAEESLEAEQLKFMIYPEGGMEGDFFTIEAEPGSLQELTVVIGNGGEMATDVRTYVADVVPATNGGFSLAQEDAPLTGMATWLDYPTETYALEPLTGIERPFSVAVPEDAAPGQYVAGLVLQNAAPLSIAGDTQYTQVIRKLLPIVINVPGAVTPSFQLGAPEVEPQGTTVAITLSVENTGNIRVRPSGTLTLTDTNGAVVVTAPITMESVYAGMTVPLYVQLMTPVPAGDYMVSVSLTDEETGATASLPDQSITIAYEERVEVQFTLTGSVTMMPDENDPVYAEIAVEIQNNGEPVSASEVSVDVLRDGELVETIVLIPSLALPTGTTTVSQRYIPPAGFEPGSWSFVLHLGIVDQSSGSVTNVATLDTLPTIEI